VAVFLGIGGLLIGVIFISNKSTGIEERRVLNGATLIPRAQGAEIDTAALTVQSAPFLASVNTAQQSPTPVLNTDVLYGGGALRDTAQILAPQKVVTTSKAKKALATGIVYQIKTGDTLDSISASFGVPKDKIVQFNPSVNFSSLDPGISIIIPGERDLNIFTG
jgi:LysM repeat protein